MNLLTDIPPNVRLAAYLTAWLTGTLSQGTAVVWAAVAAASPDVSMPMWLVITAAALGFITSQLNLLARANVPSYEDVVDGEAAPPDERGAANWFQITVVILLGLLVLLAAGLVEIG
jgi:hypothetical protein